MSTNKTENLKLHSWVPTDPFRMTEFNENFSAIDAAAGDALAAMTEIGALQTSVAKCGNCGIVTGSYTGSGTYGSANKMTLTFPKKPLLVIIRPLGDAGTMEAVLFNGITSTSTSASTSINVSWSGNTVSWYGSNALQQLNTKGATYGYVCLYAAG